MSIFRKVGAAALLLAQIPAFAATAVRVDFEGLTALSAGTRADVAVSDYYAGGSSKVPGTATPVVAGPATALGVVFGPEAYVTESTANSGATSSFGATRNLLLEDGTSLSASSALGTGILYSPVANAVTLTFAAGFTTGLSFFFNSASDFTVSVLGSSGAALTSEDFSFSSTVLCPSVQSRCAWNAASLPFSGTAIGVRFSGLSGDFALDNITLGQLDPLSALPTTGNGGGGGGGGNPIDPGPVVPIPPGVITPVPEPDTYGLVALGLAVLALAFRQRRVAVAA